MNFFRVRQQVEVHQADRNRLKQVLVGVAPLHLFAVKSGAVVDGTFEIVAYAGAKLDFNIILSALAVAGLEVEDRPFVLDVLLSEIGLSRISSTISSGPCKSSSALTKALMVGSPEVVPNTILKRMSLRMPGSSRLKPGEE